jgi:hypothetical protein
MGFGFLRDLKIYEKCLSITSEAPRHWWCEDEIHSWEIQFIGHVVAEFYENKCSMHRWS